MESLAIFAGDSDIPVAQFFSNLLIVCTGERKFYVYFIAKEHDFKF